MAKRFGFFNSINGDRKYLAADLSQAFGVGISTGLKADNADNFKIVPNANMQVKMMPGGAMIFGHYLLDEEEELIDLDVADATLNRIDRIVLRYDRFERSIKSTVIKGTPALTPVAPAILRANDQFDLVLADVYVSKAVTTITAANITDKRESDLCGFIGVKGATSQIDFDAHVSETSGKHITESGSNANGEYIKFDDGTMICTMSVSTSPTARTTIPFPSNFKDDNIKFSTAVLTIAVISVSCLLSNATTSAVDAITLRSDSSIIATTLNVIAIGRWK